MTKTTRYAANTAAAALAAIALGLAAPAGAYEVTGTLEGDPRASSPDGIFINVKVDVGNSADGCSGLGNQCSFWRIDLDMAGDHPQAKLQEFYFNLGQNDEDPDKFTGVTFHVVPMDWTVTPVVSDLGSGTWTPTFMFEANGETQITNTVDLTFNMILSAGESFDVGGATNDFVGGNLRKSSTTAFEGSWQMGAKVQSLLSGGPSGFAVGDFDRPDEPPPPPPGVPEPGTLALFGLGLVGLRLARRQRIL